MPGKNFNLFLMDGEVTGRMKCTLSNWTGVAYKIPRSYLDKSRERQDLKQSGVYFLFSKKDDGTDEVYIGQAGIRKNENGSLGRVIEHLNDIDFNDVIILTTQNNSFGPTEISYLENRFTKMAVDMGRYIVANKNEPNRGNVTEEKEAELEEFIEYSKMVIGVLGYKIFIPLVKQEKSKKEVKKDNEELFLYLKRKTKGGNQIFEAKCVRTNEGFVVLKGSMIKKDSVPSLQRKLKEIRERCKANNEIVDGKITKNYLFNSPSSAASFVTGTSENGRESWKTKDGVTLKTLEENMLIESKNKK